MSEVQEALVREKTLVLLARNQGNQKNIQRIIEQFLKCIKG